MMMKDIIAKKRDGLALSTEEIKYWIEGYVKGDIPDYQVSALLMAILFKGMNNKEISDLTFAMMHSGEVLDLSNIKGIKTDKHSTGGVGDKTSLVVGPLVASLGVKVAKMSGRGLGHTGGTLDKLESIPGVTIELTSERFEKQVNEIGVAIMGQTADLVPADKLIYALRDVTGTVAAPALIASSIMSKKLATGSDTICLDVKFGSGSIFPTLKAAEEEARLMVDIGKSLHRDTRAVLTSMDQPLGKAVGNILEVKEAIDTLNGVGPKDFYEVCVDAACVMLTQAKKYNSYEEARPDVVANLKNGKAMEYFKKMISAQGGDISYVEDPSKFEVAKHLHEVKSIKEGYVHSIQTMEVGYISCDLGAGRVKKGDKVDFTAGIMFEKKVGDYVNVGDTLAIIHTNHDSYQHEIDRLIDAYDIRDEKCEEAPIIYKVID